MSEFYKPASPEEKAEFKEALLNAPNQDAVDTVIEDKSLQILAELKESLQSEQAREKGGVDSEIEETPPEQIDLNQQNTLELQKKSEIDESQVIAILDQYIPLSVDGGKLKSENISQTSEVIYSQILNHENVVSHDSSIDNTISYTLDRIEKALPNIKRALNIISAVDDIDHHNPSLISYTKTLLDYQSEIILLKEQLSHKLETPPFLEENSIQEALNTFRVYKTKFKKLSETSSQADDIENIMTVYEQYIKEEFAKSPEKYGIGKSKAFNLDVNTLIDQFTEVELIGQEKSHQTNIAESKIHILNELRQTPGIIGVIPITEGTIGSKSADIIAITLKSKDMSPDEIDSALHALYAQIQTSARSIDTDTLDFDNIDLYDQNGRISLSETQSDSILNLSDLFQVHLIKLAKRSTDLKYDTAHQPPAQAMARFSLDWNDPNNTALLTDSYYEKKDDRMIKSDFNRALFQLSVQDILNLPLA